MPLLEEQSKKVSKIAKRAGQAASWGAIGEVAGLLIGLLVPDTIIADALIAHSLGTLLAALSGLGLFSKFKTTSVSDLAACLDDADRLFAKGVIDEKQHMRIREHCLKKFLK